MKDTWFSNCLIEAVKAKIRYGNKISLKYVSAFHNLKVWGVFCPHFYWKNKQTGKQFSFRGTEKMPFPFLPLFKGRIVQYRNK